MVALIKTASGRIIIAASLVTLLMLQIGSVEGNTLTKAFNAIHDTVISEDTTSLSFTISVPHDAASSIIGNDMEEPMLDTPIEDNYDVEENEDDEDEDFDEEDEDETDPSVSRRTKRMKMRGSGSGSGRSGSSRSKTGGSKTNQRGYDDDGDSRTTGFELEQCIQDVLDSPPATRSNETTIAPETRSPSLPTMEPSSNSTEEKLFIRHLSTDIDGSIDRVIATCDQQITAEMQQMVSK